MPPTRAPIKIIARTTANSSIINVTMSFLILGLKQGLSNKDYFSCFQWLNYDKTDKSDLRFSAQSLYITKQLPFLLLLGSILFATSVGTSDIWT